MELGNGTQLAEPDSLYSQSPFVLSAHVTAIPSCRSSSSIAMRTVMFPTCIPMLASLGRSSGILGRENIDLVMEGARFR